MESSRPPFPFDQQGLVALFRLSAFIPRMVQRGRGGNVINVSSAAGYSASSALAVCNATKFGVLGLSEALWEELRPHRIGVTAGATV